MMYLFGEIEIFKAIKTNISYKEKRVLHGRRHLGIIMSGSPISS